VGSPDFEFNYSGWFKKGRVDSPNEASNSASTEFANIEPGKEKRSDYAMVKWENHQGEKGVGKGSL